VREWRNATFAWRVGTSEARGERPGQRAVDGQWADGRADGERLSGRWTGGQVIGTSGEPANNSREHSKEAQSRTTRPWSVTASRLPALSGQQLLRTEQGALGGLDKGSGRPGLGKLALSTADKKDRGRAERPPPALSFDGLMLLNYWFMASRRQLSSA
jgi:hypothetical protein